MSQLRRSEKVKYERLNYFIIFYELSKCQKHKVKKEGIKPARCIREEKAVIAIKKQYLEKIKVNSSKDKL